MRNDATKKLPGEGGFKSPWPPLIKMDAAVKAKVGKLFGGAREFVTFNANNPKGIASCSPRLRGTSYLGYASSNGNQPQRGCDHNSFGWRRDEFAATPWGLFSLCHRHPR
jgi:hypothetical protein